MKNLAIGFKNLALAKASEETLRRALRRVFEAMTQEPYLVAGRNRFCYDFMRSLPGRGVTKLGAESIQGLGLVDPPIGISVKVTDGAIRALGPICLRVLKDLGIVTNLERLPYLQPYESPVVRNARGIETGRMVVDFVLRKA